MARFRPILMTTIAMVIAMIPIAVATGAGAEWKNGLAWVLIGGLTSSMLLTLIIVPVAYLAVDTIKDRIAAKKERRKKGKKRNCGNLMVVRLQEDCFVAASVRETSLRTVFQLWHLKGLFGS